MKKVIDVAQGIKIYFVALVFYSVVLAASFNVWALTPAEPVVAIHVSELTQSFETTTATPPTPIPPADATGFEWWLTSWHYFVGYESLKEALRSDGTPFVEVNDADIAAGNLLHPDGSPKYPILFSLASEATASTEIAPLLAYVSAGGILFIGSSALTRNPDGTTLGDFALANEMGLHMVNPNLRNWYENMLFNKVADHRLVDGIPTGALNWRMPLYAEVIPNGVWPDYPTHWIHDVFQVAADSGTTVIADGGSGPLLATRQYGKGNFIYHGPSQPLIGYGGNDPGMYAYLIYRHAVEWAFEAANLPIIKLSPWRYDYNAAFIVRHDFDNDQSRILSIGASASFENSLGAKGDYYFCTGTLRSEMTGTFQSGAIAGLQSAVANGATIGSYNGGFKNPVNPTLPMSDANYWHWGPDEALDVISFPSTTYTIGKDYAQDSILMSYQDIEGWLAGLANGRSGCIAGVNCPRIWVSPYFNSTREDSYDILKNLDVVSAGEQKISPFPHWTLSTKTGGYHYPHVTLPLSDWYVGSNIPNLGGAIDEHTSDTMRAAVDFYYNLGALTNIYGHIPSIGGPGGNIMGEYVTYAVAKPNMWKANAVRIYDWWKERSNAVVSSLSYTTLSGTAISRATITGATDPNTAIELVIPNWNSLNVTDLQVLLDSTPIDTSKYRVIGGNVVKILVSNSTSTVEVQYPIHNPVPTTTSLSPVSAIVGGSGFTLTVNGTGFVDGSVVEWNGSSRTTSYVSSVQLTATIMAADIATAGTASVTVFNPTPGGGTSNIASFTIDKVSQTITVGTHAPASAAYNAQFTVAATASSGLGVTYSSGSTSICTNVGATFTMVSGTGTCVVQYDQTGDATYSAATRVTENSTAQMVNQATLNIVAPASLAYGSTATLSSTGGSGSGLVSYGTGTSTGCSVSIATLSVTDASGTCFVMATKAADTDYNAATSSVVSVTLTKINQATLNIVAPASLAYGSTATLSSTGGSGSGLVSYGTGTSTGCSVSDATLSVTNASGTCFVTATKAADINYNATTSSVAAVTLQKNNQTITFGALSIKAVGDLDYAPGGTASSGLTVSYASSNTGVATIVGGNIHIVSAGTTTITASQTGDTNFNAATSVLQGLTVAAGNQTITVVTSAPANAAYNSQFTVAATASSSLAVTYSSGSPSICTNVGATFTMVSGTGYCVVQYDQAGNANYGAATRVTENTTVLPPNGDLNSDNIVDVTDALKALRIAAGLDTPTASDIAHGDVAPLENGIRTPNGKIDLSDVVAILRNALKLPSW